MIRWISPGSCAPGVCGVILNEITYSEILTLYMPNPSVPDPQPATEASAEPNASFADILAQHEQGHSHKTEDGSKRLEATVVAITVDSVLLDIGYKSEGILPLAVLQMGTCCRAYVSSATAPAHSPWS